VYYSISYNFEELYQSRDRIHRKGQMQPCTYISLLAEGTIDEVIYNVVNKKGSAANVIEDLVRLRK
jgi:SNF2 family DNA or RNA helicase